MSARNIEVYTKQSTDEILPVISQFLRIEICFLDFPGEICLWYYLKQL